MREHVLRVLFQHFLKLADGLGEMVRGGKHDCPAIAQVLIEAVLGVRTGAVYSGAGAVPREVAQGPETRYNFRAGGGWRRFLWRRVAGSQREKPLLQASRHGFLAVVEIVQLSGIFGEIVELRLRRLDVLEAAHAKA